MTPKASPLNIVDFAIINLEYAYIPLKEKVVPDFKEIFSDYEMDIDFSINSDDIIQVLIKAEINRSKDPLPGYSLFAEVACLFEFNKKIKITNEVRQNIEGFSTIYIALNNLRGFISQITANGPVGRYILPSIDLNDLIEKKKNILLNEGKKTIKKKKTVNK